MRMFECPLCDEKFPDLRALKRHYKLAHDTKYCPICKKRYKRLTTHASDMWFFYNCEKHLVLYWLTKRTYTSKILKAKIIYDILAKKKIKF